MTEKLKVRRVARAICKANGDDPDYMDGAIPEWKKYKVDARAAIYALRSGK